MSFVDRSASVDRHLGVSIVAADTRMEAIRKAWRLGINPGGAIMLYDVSQHAGEFVDSIDTALTPEQIQRWGRPRKAPAAS